MSLSVSVLITNYETWPDAAQCARKVLEHSENQLERILVIDDASNASPPAFPDRVDVLRNDRNQGFPATLNRGFRELKEDIIVHFDADGYPVMDFATSTKLAFVENEELGVLGYHMVNHDGEMTGSFTPASSISLPGFIFGQRFRQLFTPSRKTDLRLPNACGTAVRRSAFVEAGGFDESFDLLDVDLDLFLRLARMGWDVQYTSQIRAYHEGGGTPQTTATRVQRHHRDRWRFLRKHGHVRFPTLVKLLLACRHSLEYVVLRTLGTVLFEDRARVRDKTQGRCRLLRSVWNDYEDAAT
jgi:GT2 family glycosyltransferase